MMMIMVYCYYFNHHLNSPTTQTPPPTTPIKYTTVFPVVVVQARYKEVLADPTYINSVLAEGREKADQISTRSLNYAKEAMGFLRP